jgi:hypothetical protein
MTQAAGWPARYGCPTTSETLPIGQEQARVKSEVLIECIADRRTAMKGMPVVPPHRPWPLSPCQRDGVGLSRDGFFSLRAADDLPDSNDRACRRIPTAPPGNGIFSPPPPDRVKASCTQKLRFIIGACVPSNDQIP